MGFILFVSGYKKGEGYCEDNISEFSSFDLASIEECVEFIKWHRSHIRNLDECSYGYEIVDVEGDNDGRE